MAKRTPLVCQNPKIISLIASSWYISLLCMLKIFTQRHMIEKE